MKRQMEIFLGFVFVMVFSTVSTGFGQVTNASVGIAGLSCPFCAYGLEKQLKKLDGVGEVKIQVNKGLAELMVKKEGSIAVEQVSDAVKKAGFTPKEITITAIGHVGEIKGLPSFEVSDEVSEIDIIFLLDENAQFEKLKKALKREQTKVKVTGKIHKEIQEGHSGHPYTIVVQSFEIL